MLKKYQQFEILIVVALICVTTELLFTHTESLVIYNQQNFHIWQLFSSHFFHYDLKHFSLNIAALGFLLYLFPFEFKSLIRALLVALILIDINLIFSDITFYAGFSGLLYAIPGLACSYYILQKKYAYTFLIISIFIGYTVMNWHEVNMSNGIIWKPYKQAHLLGFLGGFISGIINSKPQYIKKEA